MNYDLFVCPSLGNLSDLIFLLSPPIFKENCVEFPLLESYFSLDMLSFGQMVVVMVGSTAAGDSRGGEDGGSKNGVITVVTVMLLVVITLIW